MDMLEDEELVRIVEQLAGGVAVRVNIDDL
jgi:hypothetical protein